MNKSTGIVIGVIVAVVLVLGLALMGGYNGMVAKRETVEGSFADIDTVLQRRADLIPNLVNAVKGYVKHEEKVFADVSEARTKLMGANTIAEKSEANNQLMQATKSLLMIAERYPDLKADKSFTQLNDELAGTENRIATARKRYNDAVKDFNKTIKKFPNNMIANMFGFEEAEYFKAEEKAMEVPNVNFD